jgi:hypothetical protein
MAIGTFDERTVLTQQVLMLPADGTATKVLAPVNSSDRRIDAITVTNRDTIAHVVTASIVVGATTVAIGSVSIPAGQGFAGTPAIDLLAAILPATVVGVNLGPSATFNVTLAVAIQATFDVGFWISGGVF